MRKRPSLGYVGLGAVDVSHRARAMGPAGMQEVTSLSKQSLEGLGGVYQEDGFRAELMACAKI